MTLTELEGKDAAVKDKIDRKREVNRKEPRQ